MRRSRHVWTREKSWDEAAISKHPPGACNHGNVDSCAYGNHVDVLLMLLALSRTAQDHAVAFLPEACLSGVGTSLPCDIVKSSFQLSKHRHTRHAGDWSEIAMQTCVLTSDMCEDS
jgi:hypothetical protein